MVKSVAEVLEERRRKLTAEILTSEEKPLHGPERSELVCLPDCSEVLFWKPNLEELLATCNRLDEWCRWMAKGRKRWSDHRGGYVRCLIEVGLGSHRNLPSFGGEKPSSRSSHYRMRSYSSKAVLGQAWHEWAVIDRGLWEARSHGGKDPWPDWEVQDSLKRL